MFNIIIFNIIKIYNTVWKFGVSAFFDKLILLFSNDRLNLLKVTDLYIQINAVHFELSIK